MGNVLPFKPACERCTRQRQHPRREKEPSLHLSFTAVSSDDQLSYSTSETLPTQPLSAIPQPRSPLVGVGIIVGAILVYALVTFHLVGQPHYSARANLLPALLVQN
jgi:hypothetical protein